MYYSQNLKKNKNIQHCFFSRRNGTSTGIYKSLNCGLGSNDNKINIKKNLDIVSKQFKIDSKQLIFMNQTHSNKVVMVKNDNLTKIQSDAMITVNDNIALCVLTADCAPILLFEENKKIIGCIHAGWKGAVEGIIKNTVNAIKEIGGNIEKIFASVGPCIDQKNYEVKDDFYLRFLEKSKKNESFFLRNSKNGLNFDLRGFVNKNLKDLGIIKIDNISVDSFTMKNEYFSHRRAKKLGENDYGRCVSVIKKIVK